MKTIRRDKSITALNDPLWNRAKAKCVTASYFMGLIREGVEQTCRDIIGGRVVITTKQRQKTDGENKK